MSIPQAVGNGGKLTIRVTNPKDPVFGVIKAEKTITIERPEAAAKDGE